MTTETDKTERERFEAWFRTQWPEPTAFDRLMQDHERYAHPLTRGAWEAWQARALDTGAVPEGWKLVPVEPTDQMVKEGSECASAAVYRRMLAAAPQPSASADDDADLCPVCSEPIRTGDTYATDIEMGTCHAACLEGSPVVDLETGEPSDWPATTFVREAEPLPASASAGKVEPVAQVVREAVVYAVNRELHHQEDSGQIEARGWNSTAIGDVAIEAMSKHAQTPVAWRARYIGERGWSFSIELSQIDTYEIEELQPLYTAPSAHPDARQAAEALRHADDLEAFALVAEAECGADRCAEVMLDAAAFLRALPLPGDKEG